MNPARKVAPVMDRHAFLTKAPAVAGIAIFCTLLWGSSFPLIKTGYGLLGISNSIGGIIFFAACRFLLAAVIMFSGMKMAGMPIAAPDRKDYRWLALIALLQTAIQFSFFYIGLASTTGMKASIINGSGSFFIVILSHLFIPDDRLSLKKISGVMLGFAGLVLVNFDRSLLDCSFSVKGEGFILLTSITGAVGSLVIKKVSHRISAIHITAYQFFLGSLMLFAISFFFELPDPSTIAINAKILLLLLHLGIISSVSFSLWYLLIRHNRLSRIAVFFFLVPIWGTIFSALLMKNEYLTPVIVIALALVSLGIYLTNRE